MGATVTDEVMHEDPALEYALGCIVRRSDGLWPDPESVTPDHLRALVHEHHHRLSAWKRRGAQVFCHHDLASETAAVFLTTASRTFVYGLCAPNMTLARESVLSAIKSLPARPWSLGGPPGGYLLSGWPEPDGLSDVWTALGFTRRSQHVDLHVELLREPDLGRTARVRRVEPHAGSDLLEWVRAVFGDAWRQEVADAVEHDASVFVAGAPGAWQGFAAHSGHNRAVGTFGPLGVDPGARGSGVGSALARAALDDLAARGFSHAVIPWVDPARVPLYARCVAGIRERAKGRWVRAVDAEIQQDSRERNAVP